MADKILVPLDGSSQAEQILAQVARLLKREDAEVILTRVTDNSYAYTSKAARIMEEERKSSATYLQKAVDTLQAQGIRARALPLEGTVSEAILEAAKREGATLIALSTHGRTGAARWALGSVAEKVVRGAPVPVLLMRSAKNGPQGIPLPAGAVEIPFRRILVPVDGSEASLEVVPAAATFAKRFEAEVDVLSVEVPLLVPMGPEFIPTASPMTTREAAEKAASRFEERGIRVRTLTAIGDAAAGILDTAGLEGSDLIAMATHGLVGCHAFHARQRDGAGASPFDAADADRAGAQRPERIGIRR
jgi:nucleotide-binding universal stress UspA family protein